jgi:hypothetical protein
MRRLREARLMNVMGKRRPAWVQALLIYHPLTEYVTEPVISRRHVCG